MTRRRGEAALRGLSYFEIERISREARYAFAPKASALRAFPVYEAFDSLGESLVFGAGIEGRVEYLSSGIEAITYVDGVTDTTVVSLSEAIYNGLERNESRARFTVSHEFGHAVLHRKDLAARMLANPHGLARSDKKEHEICFDTEWQADAFAGALLMPADGLEALESQLGGWLTEEDVSAHFLTSFTAAQTRLYTFRWKRRQLLSAAIAVQL